MKKLRMFFFMIATFVALSAFKGDDGFFKNGDKWIPLDFDSRNGVLLVENFVLYVRGKPNKGTLKATEQMKEHMKEHYPYKYEFVDAVDLENPKYEDIDKYRYVIMWSHDTHAGKTSYNANAPQGSSAFNSGVSHDSNVFHIYDRKKNEHTRDTGKPTGYAITTFKPTINTIVKFLQNLK